MKASITLSADDSQRLFAIKKLQGKDNQTAEEFLEVLIHRTLYSMFPPIPEVDELGNITNADKYKGVK